MRSVTLLAVTMLLVATLVLAGCGPTAAPVQEPTAAAPTQQPTQVAAQEPTAAPPTEPPTEVVVQEPTQEPSPEPTEEVATGSPPKVALLVTDVVQDQSWNQFMYEGLVELQDQGLIELSYAENVDIPDFERVAADYAEEGYDLIIGHTFDYQEPALKVAEEYPDTHFVVTGAWELAPNLASVNLWPHEGGYLAGMLGALMSKTGKLGLVGGFAYAPSQLCFHEAFKLGAKAVNPDIEILETWTQTWYDVALGYEAAMAQMDAGVDFMAISLSGPGIGVINAAHERNAAGQGPVYVVGAFVDMNEIAPDTVITSVVWQSADPVKAVLDSIANGTFEGKAYDFGLPEGGCDLAPYHDLASAIPQDVQDQIEQARQAIISGELEVPLITEAPAE